MMKNLQSIHKQQGLSLIEIMIGAMLSAFLLVGIIQVYSSSKQSYRMMQSLSRLQENGRFAINFISEDIRQAGLVCQLFGYSIYPILIENETTKNAKQANTDSIRIHRAISCPSGSLFQITYTIETSTRGSWFSLYKKKGNNPSQELVEGITNMQILYGVDSDGDNIPNCYLNDLTVTNASQVVSVRVSLLATTLEDNISSAPIPYYFNGETVTPTDRRLRRMFSSTIVLRNSGQRLRL